MYVTIATANTKREDRMFVAEHLIEHLRQYLRKVGEYPSSLPQDMVEFGEGVVRGKYTLPGEKDYVDVVARVVGSVVGSADKEKLEKLRSSPYFREILPDISKVEDVRTYIAEQIAYLFITRQAIAGGRIMAGAGVTDRRVTLTNCYVLPSPEDSFEGIMKTAEEMALTYRAGGGVGVDISSLRPEGSPVRNAALTSSGAWSFTHLFSTVTGVVGQKGRRGALLVSMSIEHPDAVSFALSKSTPDNHTREVLEFLKSSGWSAKDLEVAEKVMVWNQNRFANISLQVTDEFMQAVQNDSGFLQRYSNGRIRVEKNVSAKGVWNTIVESAWASGDPGILFVSTAKKYSTTEYFAPVVTTNPCGEQWLSEYDNCNLAAINLSDIHVLRDLKSVVSLMVLFMDLVIDYNLNHHPLPGQVKAAEENRRIGLGFAGFAEMLANEKVPWSDVERVREVVKKTVGAMVTWSYLASVELGRLWGSFKHFDPEKHWNAPFFHRIVDHLLPGLRRIWEERILGSEHLRNSALNTVAPTGSISAVLGTSSGIEPFFFRHVSRYSPSLGRMFTYTYRPYVEYEGVPDEELPEYLKTAHQIDPEHRVLAQSFVQVFIDNAISSTINLPQDATPEDVERIYRLAWENELKGITVFRHGSKYSVVSGDGEKSSEDAEKDAQKKVSVVKTKELFSRPSSMKCVRYRVPVPENGGSKINIVVCGDVEEGLPLEVYIASWTALAYSHKVALNMVISTILTALHNSGNKELYDAVLSRIIRKLTQIKDEPFVVFGQKVNSVVGAIGMVLDMFRKRISPEDVLRQSLDLKVPLLAGSPEPDNHGEEISNETASLSDEQDVRVVSKAEFDSMGEEALSYFIAVCPSCSYIHLTTKYPWPFDCNHPCQVCGYSGKCSG